MIKLFLGALLLFAGHSAVALATPASEDSVRELMQKSGAGDLGVQMVNQIMPALKKMVPDAGDEFWQAINDEIRADAIIEKLIPLYQKYYSEEDLVAINAFYDTEVGKKLVRLQPVVLQESMQIGQQWGQQIAREVIRKYNELQQAKP